MSTDIALPHGRRSPGRHRAASGAPASEARPAPAGPGGHVELPPLTGLGASSSARWSLSLAVFMNVLDTSIANVSIPAISGDLGVSPAQGTWVITSFAVANAISVPLTGWMARRIGSGQALRRQRAAVRHRFLALRSCAEHRVAHCLSGHCKGLVAGPMIPLSQTLLMGSYPKAKVGLALALWSMTTLVAPVLGPLLGGWITDNMSWPWIFYINVPVGLFSAGLTWSIYRKRDSGPNRIPLDYVGLGLLVLWVGAMQIMLDKGKELDWFNSGVIVILAVVTVVAFLFFLAWELTEKNPIVDLTLFKGRNFTFGVIALSVAYGLFFGNLVLLPLWLQQIVGYPATDAGMAMAPVGLLAIFMSPWVGKNVGKIDPRIFASMSFLTFTLVLWMRSRFTVGADFETIVIPTIIQGAALAFFFIPLLSIVMSNLHPSRIPSAAGLSNFVRITAGAVGTSLFQTAWDDRAAMHHAHLTDAINNGSASAGQALQQLGVAGYSNEQSLGVINRLIDQQAFTMSVDDLFLLSAWLFLLLVPLVWLTKRFKAAGGVDAGGAH